MNAEERNPILVRVERLERQNRRLKQGALVCLAAVASVAVAGALMGQTQTHKTTKSKPAAAPAPAPTPAAPVVPEKIEAESFVLKDSSGRDRAELSMGGIGPSLRFLDQTGTALLTISLNDGTPGGPMLLLAAPDRHATVSVSAQQGAGPQLSMTGNQSAQVHVGVTKDGTTIELYDQNGASATIGNSVKVSRSGDAKQTAGSSILLYNKDRKLLWSAP